MKKIFKGYAMAGSGNTTEVIFQNNNSYKTLASFLYDEECFAEWLKEHREDLVEKEFSHLDWNKLDLITDKEWQELFDRYNEGDELGTYYTIDEDLDNTKDFIEFYGVETAGEAIEAHKRYTEMLEQRESYSDYKNECEESIYNATVEAIEKFETKYNLNK